MGRRANAAVQNASLKRGVELLAGLKAFREAEYVRTLPDPPVIWRQGGSTLMDYGAPGKSAPAVLFVPSLINRPYVLDLTERTSLLRFLHAESIHPFLLDWGSPGAEELDFDTGAYIAMRLIPAIERVAALTQRPVTLAGYCMGGMLALAAAQATPSLVSKLVLLATPWDFHSSDFRRIALDEDATDKLNAFIRSNRFLPPEYVQNLFYVMDPWLFHRKYQRFGKMNPRSEEAREFLALESWVNDGVPLTRKVAQECLIDWAQDNMPLHGRWRPLGEPVSPSQLRIPSLIAIPARDRIVPPGSAIPLSAMMPHATVLRPDAGHVGMVASLRARKSLWIPLARWLKTPL